MPLTPFDDPDALNSCRMIMRRIKGPLRHHKDEQATILQWRWDLVDCLELSRQTLQDALPKLEKLWQELATVLEQQEQQMPSVLRQTLEDIKRQKDPWVTNFVTDFASAWKSAENVKDRLLYEEPSSGWFGGSPTGSEVLCLLEYLETLLDKVVRMNRQLDLVLKTLSQTLIGSCATQTFKERTVKDQFTSTVVSFAAIVLMPVPGIMETWAISTGYMWLSEDSSAAGRLMVVEHGKETDANQVLTHFETDPMPENLAAVKEWQENITGERCAFLMHNASPRRVEVKLVAKCSVGKSDMREAFEAHPMCSISKKLANWGASDAPAAIVLPRQMKIIELPELLDLNWYFEATFKHVTGSNVGSCCVKPNAIFSLVAVDVGVRVHAESDAVGDEIRIVNSSIAPCTVKVYPAGCNRVFTAAKFDASLKVSESATYKLQEEDQDAFLELDVSLPRHHATVDVQGGQTIRVDGIFDPSG